MSRIGFVVDIDVAISALRVVVRIVGLIFRVIGVVSRVIRVIFRIVFRIVSWVVRVVFRIVSRVVGVVFWFVSRVSRIVFRIVPRVVGVVFRFVSVILFCYVFVYYAHSASFIFVEHYRSGRFNPVNFHAAYVDYIIIHIQIFALVSLNGFLRPQCRSACGIVVDIDVTSSLPCKFVTCDRHRIFVKVFGVYTDCG